MNKIIRKFDVKISVPIIGDPSISKLYSGSVVKTKI